MSKLPQQVKLIIIRQFGKKTWEIKLVLNDLKSNIEAREEVVITDSMQSSSSSSSSLLHEDEMYSGMTLNAVVTPRDNLSVFILQKIFSQV